VLVRDARLSIPPSECYGGGYLGRMLPLSPLQLDRRRVFLRRILVLRDFVGPWLGLNIGLFGRNVRLAFLWFIRHRCLLQTVKPAKVSRLIEPDTALTQKLLSSKSEL